MGGARFLGVGPAHAQGVDFPWTFPAHAQGVDFPWTFGLAYESPQGDWFHAKSFWCLIGVAVRDGEPILCEVRATPLGVLFRPVLTQKVQGKSTPKLLSSLGLGLCNFCTRFGSDFGFLVT